MLLVVVDKFDLDPIIVNINKLKPYGFLNDNQLLQALHNAPKKSEIYLQHDTIDDDDVGKTTASSTIPFNFILAVFKPATETNSRAHPMSKKLLSALPTTSDSTILPLDWLTASDNPILRSNRPKTLETQTS